MADRETLLVQENRFPLDAVIWFRQSTQEWVLEISGAINDTSFVNRHTAPKETAPEDVAGLGHLYLDRDQLPALSTVGEVPTGEIYNCDCGGDEVSGHTFGCAMIQDSAALKRQRMKAIRSVEADALEHLQNVMAHVATPIGRRRLNIDPDNPPEWFSGAQAFLEKEKSR